MAILLTFTKKFVAYWSLHYECPQKYQRPKVTFKKFF